MDETTTGNEHTTPTAPAADELGSYLTGLERLARSSAPVEQTTLDLIAAIRERDARIRDLEAESESDDFTRGKMASLLTRTADALKGPPAELTRHSWHDLPELAAKAARGLDSLRVIAQGPCTCSPPSDPLEPPDCPVCFAVDSLRGEEG